MSFDFGSWLEKSGLTVAEYAEIFHKSPNTIYRRVRGELGTDIESAVLLDLLERSAKDLGVDIAELVNRQKDTNHDRPAL